VLLTILIVVGHFTSQSKPFSQLIPKSVKHKPHPEADFIGQLKPAVTCQETIKLHEFSLEFRKFMDSSPTNITATGMKEEKG